MDKFPHIQLKGTPEEIGKAHGSLLKTRIERTIDFYTDTTETLDNQERIENQEKILTFAKGFQKEIINFNPNYQVEIEAIASAADVDPLWIYALNSRTEIISNLKMMEENECTALFFGETRILGQNWDWASAAEELAVTMTIERPDGHKIMQMTEPGIIGKIGLNNKGLGVCLNFLVLNQELDGLPVHIILRSFLDSNSIDEAIHCLEPVKLGKSSNIILADAYGNWRDIEFAGKEIYFLDNSSNIIMHTNHFVQNSALNTKPDDLQSSFSRYNRATSLIQQKNDWSIDNMKRILFDDDNTELPICRKYGKGVTMKNTGTVCTIVMDLQRKKMDITKGNPFNHEFTTIHLES